MTTTRNDWQLTDWEKVDAQQCYDVRGRKILLIRSGEDWELWHPSGAPVLLVYAPSHGWGFFCGPDITAPTYETLEAVAKAAMDYLWSKEKPF